MIRQTDDLNEVFRRHYPALLNWCKKHVKQSLGDPEDFVHSAYLRCARRWSVTHRSSHNEVAYLYQALRWTVLDALRKDYRNRVHPSPSPRCRTGFPRMVLAECAAVDSLNSLKGRPSQVCSAVLAGKSESRIREELNLTQAALAVYLCRAKADLCQLLEVPKKKPMPRKTDLIGQER